MLANITEKYPNIKKEDLEHLSLVESEIDLRDKKAIQTELAKRLKGHKDALYFEGFKDGKMSVLFAELKN